MKLEWEQNDAGQHVANIGDLHYCVGDSSRTVEYLTNKYMVSRDVNYDEMDSLNRMMFKNLDVGYISKDGIIRCGFGTFCAIGLPLNSEFDTVEEAKLICELDVENILREFAKGFLEKMPKEKLTD